MKSLQWVGAIFVCCCLFTSAQAQPATANKSATLVKSKQSDVKSRLQALQIKYQKLYRKYRMIHTLWVIEKLKCSPRNTVDYKRMKKIPQLFRDYHSR